MFKFTFKVVFYLKSLYITLQRPASSNNNGGELFTTLHIPLSSQLDELCTSLPNVPEFPRHQLRLLEKLGEGAFGMVSVNKQTLRCCKQTDQLISFDYQFFVLLFTYLHTAWHAQGSL